MTANLADFAQLRSLLLLLGTMVTASGAQFCHRCAATAHLSAHCLALKEWSQGEWEARKVEVKPRSALAAGSCACLLTGALAAEAPCGLAAYKRLLLLLLLL